MGGLLLYVRLHGQVIPVDAEPDATVQQLMQRVAEAVGGEPPLLQFQGADLNPEDLISDTGVSQEATLDAVRRRVFRYEHDFDENGLFYYIGTLGLQEPWKNPDSERRLVSCQKKPEWFSPSSSPASNLVGREGSYCRTEKALRAHFEVDISRVGSIAPTHYTLRHGRVQETYVLRSWELLGSADGEEWTLLDRREESPLRREDSEPQQGSPPYFTGVLHAARNRASLEQSLVSGEDGVRTRPRRDYDLDTRHLEGQPDLSLGQGLERSRPWPEPRTEPRTEPA
eukprot:TRINITY_DN3071_c0_g1_i2.p1 TRINITY_DN3071_c0_g1~~TRINITY_DN3071_c0_g1_i2.p1  ORF type:complete len:284 (+),score=45.40 TRINITY_DN3071_c0_g1_i2:54-905(+)